MGLWLVLFLIEHLLVNSQAALLLGESGRGFIDAVNTIHNLPYLQVIEFVLLGVPFLIHGIWGVKYLFTAKFNSSKSDGSTPSLKEYGRNKAYTWQRITSWILLVGVLVHVTKSRFLDYPSSLPQGSSTFYFTKLQIDNGLYSVADRLGATLYDTNAIEKEKKRFQERMDEKSLLEVRDTLNKDEKMTWEGPAKEAYDSQKAIIFPAAQKFEAKMKWIERLESYSLKEGEVVAVADNFGTASILTLRDELKNPISAILYTIFVLSACFHAFNGLWTFLITWGIVLRMSAQKSSVKIAVALMLLVTFLGLASVWGTYWLNLRS
jgi:succinate dehydrogenase / fumarate reductase cytochrome b subunit